jgi:Tol biopolymer transport system component
VAAGVLIACLATGGAADSRTRARTSAHVGQRIVFVDSHQQLVTIDADGRHRRQVTHLGLTRGASQPRFSPDGRRILFVFTYFDRRVNEARSQLCTIPSLGGRRTCVARNVRDPVFSPDGTHIAYVKTSSASVYLARRDGSQVRRLTRGYDEAPAFSPDGRALAFSRYVRDSGTTDLYELDLLSGQTRRITASADAPVGEVPRFPFYSADGATLLYTVDSPDDAQNVFVIKRDGTSRKRLTHNHSSNTDPSWSPRFSPDGHQIVYWSGDNPGHFLVRVMSADGTRKHTVARGTDPDWGSSVPWR